MRIMIVDDDELVLKSLSEVFEMNGYPNVSFTDPADALQAVKYEPFDVVITDCRMPNMDCYDILRQVKKMRGETSVIIITGYNHDYSDEKARAKGAYRFFRKPLDIEQLLETIEEIEDRQIHEQPGAPEMVRDHRT